MAEKDRHHEIAESVVRNWVYSGQERVDKDYHLLSRTIENELRREAEYQRQILLTVLGDFLVAEAK